MSTRIARKWFDWIIKSTLNQRDNLIIFRQLLLRAVANLIASSRSPNDVICHSGSHLLFEKTINGQLITYICVIKMAFKGMRRVHSAELACRT